MLRAALLRTGPRDLPEAHRGRYARLVRDVAATDDDPATARLALHALGRWIPWSDDGARVLAGAVTDLANRATWHAAANALIGAASSAPQGRSGLLETLRSLAGAEADEDDDAGERRDRPARQRVEYLVAGLRASAFRRRRRSARSPVPRPNCSTGTTPT